MISVILAALVSCSNEPEKEAIDTFGSFEEDQPEFVYVRSSDVTVEIQFRANQSAEVGEWIELRASRTIEGDWIKKAFADLQEDELWRSKPPPKFEEEVAANLFWHTDPKGNAHFDTGVESLNMGMKRKVKFQEAGEYRLWATSYPPIDGKSNTLTVRIR